MKHWFLLYMYNIIFSPLEKQYNEYTTFWMLLENKKNIRCNPVLLTGQQVIDLLTDIKLLTVGLIFIGSISHVILTSQYQGKK